MKESVYLLSCGTNDFKFHMVLDFWFTAYYIISG